MRIQTQGNSYVVVLEIGEQFISSLTGFAKQKQIASASISAIGALRDFELGYYYLDRKEYGRKKFEEISELISCSGNIAIRQEAPFIHVHALLGRDDFTVIGGHLFEGIVAVTAEIVVLPLPNRMERTYDERTGLYLLSSGS
ncbi:MAG: PPC domain-containing DNA-binding protein [Acidobacteriota bacterium]